MAYSTLIEADDLAPQLGVTDWLVFDCRFDLADTQKGRRLYRESHIPGAFYAHLDRDLSSPITPHSGRHPLPDAAPLCRWLGEHGLNRRTQVIAYDDSGGNMAVRLWWLLRWLGHDRVAVLNGGWQTWVSARHRVETSRPASLQPTVFSGQPDDRMLWSTEEISDALLDNDDTVLLVDARTAERFRGDAEPIDPVAGHIPGAVNLPLQQNLGADGRFRDADSLCRMYRDLLGDRPARNTAQMCGSGVTACHNLLAMEIAGLWGGRLYAGSWSEWIRDGTRPVATGGD